jgi:hypothetical protein
MGNFTIDILTGKEYLFNNNFTGSTVVSGSTYPQVNLFSDLPSAAPNTGKINIVRSGGGTYIANRKESGLYFSNGATWNLLDNPVPFFSSTNFQVYDSTDNTKGISFITSGITSGSDILLIAQNFNGTIAYLSDVNLKVNTTTFNTFTGTTLPTNYYNKTQINHFTGTTLPSNYYNKVQINSYSAQTLTNINTREIYYNSLQITDISGGTNVNNITPVSIVWATQVFSGTSLSFTGGSRIYVITTGTYDVSYVLNTINADNSSKNIGSVLRKNGNTELTQTTSTSFAFDSISNSGTNEMPPYLISLSTGDYIELLVYRIGNSGISKTKANGSWLKIKRND